MPEIREEELEELTYVNVEELDNLVNEEEVRTKKIGIATKFKNAVVEII